jgi:hypothetical protein
VQVNRDSEGIDMPKPTVFAMRQPVGAIRGAAVIDTI